MSDSYNVFPNPSMPPQYGAQPDGFQRRVSFEEAVKMAFSKYVCFTGRASRSEYWFWILFTLIVGAVTGTLDSLMDPDAMAITTLANLALICPSLGLVWRRLHDIGKGGGWFFICFIPFIGFIVLLFFFVKDSEMFTNRFGSVPNWVQY